MQKKIVQVRAIIECMYCGDPCIRTWGADGFGIKIVCHHCDTAITTCEICSFKEGANLQAKSWSPFYKTGECVPVQEYMTE